MEPTETKMLYLGNETIDHLVVDIQKLWQKGEQDRLAIGQYFSKLKNATKPYEQDEETGLTYSSAVKRTGVPRSTAEYYRAMWDTVDKNGIPAQVFLLLCEAGFNLATADLREDVRVQGIIHDHPELRTGEISNYQNLADTLDKEYGKKDDNQEKVADLQKFVEASEGKIPASVLASTKEKIHALRVRALTNLCVAIAPLVDHDQKWAKKYAKKYADSQVLTKQRYEEAVRFAQTLVQE